MKNRTTLCSKVSIGKCVTYMMIEYLPRNEKNEAPFMEDVISQVETIPMMATAMKYGLQPYRLIYMPMGAL